MRKYATMTRTGPLSWWNLNLEMLVFVREENWKTQRKTFGALCIRTDNKLKTHMVPGRNQTQATLVRGKSSHQ